MKKTAVLILILSAAVIAAAPSGDNRAGWWEARKADFTAKIPVLEKDYGAPPELSGFMKARIDASSAALDFIRKNSGAVYDSSYYEELLAADRALKKSEEHIRSYFCLMYFKKLMLEADNRLYGKMAAGEFRGKQNDGEDGMAVYAVQEFPQSFLNAWGSDLYFTLMMDKEDGEYNKFRKSALLEIGASLPQRGISAHELALLCSGILSGMLNTYSIELTEGGIPLEKTWTYGRARAATNGLAHRYSVIKKYAGGDAGPERIRHYHDNPSDLEVLLFRDVKLTGNYGDRPALFAEYDGTDEGRVVYEAPALPSILPVIERLDAVRRKSIVSLYSVRRHDANAEFIKAAQRVTAFYETDLRASFEKNKKSADAAARKITAAGRIPLYVNAGAFEEAERNFEDRIIFLRNHIKRSSEFVKFAQDCRYGTSEGLADAFETQARQSGDYLDYIKKLMVESSPAASGAPNDAGKTWEACVKRIDDHFTLAGNSLSLSAAEKERLNADERGRCAAAVKAFAERAFGLRAGISGSLSAYSRDKARLAGERRINGAEVLEKAAFMTLDELKTEINGYTEFYKKLRAAETALELYRNEYDVIESSGFTDRERIMRVISEGSLKSLVPGIDMDAVEVELKLKEFLRDNCRKAAASLDSHIVYYRRLGVKVNTQGLYGLMRESSETLKRYPEIEISGWKISEYNFAQADTGVAKKIADSFNRQSWHRPVSEEEGEYSRINFVSDGVRISLELPPLWVERQPGSDEIKAGVVKSFISMDMSARINIVHIEAGRFMLDELSGEWIKRAGWTPVSQKWGAGGEHEYFWVSAKDGGGRVMEIYSLIRDGACFLVTGEVSKEKFPLFSSRLNAVFRSFSN